MMSVEGVEAGVFSIDAIDEAFIKESKSVVIGTPVYYADTAGAVKTFLESCGKYALAGKIGGAFATADYIHGGGEIGIQTILTHMMVYGMLTYSGGAAYGSPVIHLGPVAVKEVFDECKETFYAYGRRMALKTKELFG